jgi:methylglutaconyl-CoA hydratase
MRKSLAIAREGSVATIWMERPEIHNAFNPELVAELLDACRELDADPSVRVVVLAGRGKSFSAGADLNWMQQAGKASMDENLADARRVAAMLAPSPGSASRPSPACRAPPSRAG